MESSKPKSKEKIEDDWLRSPSAIIVSKATSAIIALHRITEVTRESLDHISDTRSSTTSGSLRPLRKQNSPNDKNESHSNGNEQAKNRK